MIGGINTSKGMGRGAAQVYDTSGPVNMYAKLMQQQQLKRAAEQKLLTDELSKVSSEGIREADIPEFTQKYQEVKDFFGLKEGIRDRREKIKYDLEFNKKIQELKQITGDSKNIAKNEQGFTNILLNPAARERYTEDAVTKFQNSKKLSRKDPNFIRDYTVFEHQVDVSNTMKELADINKRILAPIQSVTEQEAARVGNVDGTFLRKVKRVPVEEQALAFGMAMDVNPKLKAGILKLIPKNEGESDLEYKSRALPLLVAQVPAEEYGDQVFQRNKDLTMQNLALRRERRLAAKDKDDVSISDIKVGPKTFTGTKLALFDKNTGKPIMDASGKKQLFTGKGVSAEFPVYSTVNPTAFKIPQNSSLYDIKGGVNKPIPKGISAALTGIGYAIVQGGGNELRATITTDEGDELMVKLADLPPDVRNDKFYKTTLQAVEDEYKRLQQSKPTTKPAKELIGETVRIQLPTGEIGEVPKDKSAAFLKKYPKAKIIK